MGRWELEERVGGVDSVSQGRSKQFGTQRMQMPQTYTTGNVLSCPCPASVASSRQLSVSDKPRDAEPRAGTLQEYGGDQRKGVKCACRLLYPHTYLSPHLGPDPARTCPPWVDMTPSLPFPPRELKPLAGHPQMQDRDHLPASGPEPEVWLFAVLFQ